MEIKYTTDGKKVVIIGNLNSQEKIVQEVFIVNGNEIPSGENFVVSSLHDAPAISWKEKSLKDLEERYERETKQLNTKISETTRLLNKEYDSVREKLNYVGRVLKNASEESFNMLVDYLTGNIKWVVITGWNLELVPFDHFDENCNYERNKLRLVSIFGQDDGSLSYARGNYSDASGGKEHFIPFNSYEEALAKFSELLVNKPTYYDDTINKAEKFNVSLDEEKLKVYYDNKRESLQKNIDKYKKDIESWEDALNSIK